MAYHRQFKMYEMRRGMKTSCPGAWSGETEAKYVLFWRMYIRIESFQGTKFDSYTLYTYIYKVQNINWDKLWWVACHKGRVSFSIFFTKIRPVLSRAKHHGGRQCVVSTIWAKVTISSISLRGTSLHRASRLYTLFKIDGPHCKLSCGSWKLDKNAWGKSAYFQHSLDLKRLLTIKIHFWHM